MPPSIGNDLTGELALPMFAATIPAQLCRLIGKNAVKSSDYHESCTGGIARQGENDQ